MLVVDVVGGSSSTEFTHLLVETLVRLLRVPLNLPRYTDTILLVEDERLVERGLVLLLPDKICHDRSHRL